MEHYCLEVGARTPEDVGAAGRGGADRVELYASPLEGALTPSVGFVATAAELKRQEELTLELVAMIRPRAGDMLYTDLEFAAMERDAETLRAAGADGIMCGILTPDGDLDMARMRRIIAAGGGGTFTLHRAFDGVRSQEETLEQAVELGIDRILTYGYTPDGKIDRDRLEKLADLAVGRIRIMVALGDGFRDSELASLTLASASHDIHIVNNYRKVQSRMRFVPGGEVAGDDHLHRDFTMIERLDEDVVRGQRRILDSLPR